MFKPGMTGKEMRPMAKKKLGKLAKKGKVGLKDELDPAVEAKVKKGKKKFPFGKKVKK